MVKIQIQFVDAHGYGLIKKKNLLELKPFRVLVFYFLYYCFWEHALINTSNKTLDYKRHLGRDCVSAAYKDIY
ncbi:hypothetical protein XENTR_v10018465 [Xenopus tropicalis]|nr:hypothetical protein XENTR_v10018465 [Xenopus tropicalis]